MDVKNLADELKNCYRYRFNRYSSGGINRTDEQGVPQSGHDIPDQPRMATEIKQYFEANNEVLEVLVAVGKKLVSVERYMVSERNFYKEFRKRIEQ